MSSLNKLDFKMGKSFLLLSLLTLACLACYFVQSQAVGYQQELYLYEGDADDASYHVFRESISDLSEWPFFNKKTITKVCSRGAWFYYKEANFTTYAFGNYSHTLLAQNCHVKANGDLFPFEDSLSIRFIGSKQTGLEAVSFFSEEFFQGNEYTTDPVTFQVSGIAEQVNSVVFTGYTNWTFFEDRSFNGSERCFENSRSRSLGQGAAIIQRPQDIDFYVRNPFFLSRLEAVGSVSHVCACKTEEMGTPGGRSDDLGSDDDDGRDLPFMKEKTKEAEEREKSPGIKVRETDFT